jgi:hypothetical protein
MDGGLRGSAIYHFKIKDFDLQAGKGFQKIW